jgi:hypothetical protein
MSMYKLFVLLGFAGLLFSCSSDYGKHIQGNNVTVYYTEGIETDEAVRLLEFWVNRGLSGSTRQYLQLNKVDKAYQLKLIPSDSTLLTDLPFYLTVPLMELETELSLEVFESKPCQIVLSDPQFQKSISLRAED